MTQSNPKIIASFTKTLFWVRMLAVVCVLFGVLSLAMGFLVFVDGLSVDPSRWGPDNPVTLALTRFLWGGVELFLSFLLFNYGRVIENACKLKKDFLIDISLDYQSKVWRALALVFSCIVIIAFITSTLWSSPLKPPLK